MSRRRISDKLLARMYESHAAGASLSAVAREFGRGRRALWELFKRRGLAVRVRCVFKNRLPDGRIAPLVPKTEEEIEAIIRRAERIRVPEELRVEWRKWPLARRAVFVRRLRARLAGPGDMPAGPLPAGMEAFDYGSARAHAIARALNAGRDSRSAAVKIDLCAQGIIWRDRLWFWGHKTGYQGGVYVPGRGRPLLHHAVWEEAGGRPVPAGCVLVFLDGNKNNITPENLAVVRRETLLRETQAAGLGKKSRAVTALLLKHSQQKQQMGISASLSIKFKIKSKPPLPMPFLKLKL
jgi:hypothetical protein